MWLPTGYGKSICYEVLPFLFNLKLGEILSWHFLSPLISLMVDQVRCLLSRSVEASVMSIASEVDAELVTTDRELLTNSHLFCSPEALVYMRRREAIENPDISCRVIAVVIDEAHCVSKW